MATRYYMVINGRRRYFATLDAALRAAGRIHARTGIVVGIQTTS